MWVGWDVTGTFLTEGSLARDHSFSNPLRLDLPERNLERSTGTTTNKLTFIVFRSKMEVLLNEPCVSWVPPLTPV